ncbi:MAG: CoA transferase [Paracoccaceae bacterium]|nr:CoA transferase [Paracoccaceae bacterium]
MQELRSSALNSVHVLDLGRYIAVPYAAMLLADLGAQVVRLEPPGGGPDRRFPPGPDGQSTVFRSFARGKSMVSLDIQQPEARNTLERIIDRMDVVLHNFPSGPATKLGLETAQFQARFPKTHLGRVVGFPSQSAEAGRPMFDSIAQAMSGAMSMTGPQASRPVRSAVPWVDYAAGSQLALLVLASLLANRDASPRAQAFEVSLVSVALSHCVPLVADAVAHEEQLHPMGNETPFAVPSNLFDCLDGQVMISAVTDRQWADLTSVISPDAPVVEFPTAAERLAARGEVDSRVAQWCAAHTVADIVTKLERAMVPCGPLLRPDAASLMGDRQSWKGAALGPAPEHNDALTPAAAPGADNTGFYTQLGLTPQDISDLTEKGLI